MNWYAISTKPNAEPAAYLGLIGKGIEAFCAVETLRTSWFSRKGSGVGTKASSLFPGYIFASFDPGRDMDRVLETRGVSEIMRGASGKVTPFPEKIISELKRLMELGAFDRSAARTWWPLKPGDNVRVIDGPFAGLVAQVKSATSRKRIHILVDFVHKTTLPIDKLEKIT